MKRYKFSKRSALLRPFAEMSPALQLATEPLQVPSAMSARSAFQREHTSLPVDPPFVLPAVPPVPALPIPPAPPLEVLPPAPPAEDPDPEEPPDAGLELP